ncbi:MAG TPA: DUF1772 domain-containing protein [Chitinophagaceae bacterium]|jgi:hypothetical protein
MLKIIFLFASILVASGLLMTNMYNSIVDAKAWGYNIPASIQTTREYFKAVNPGNFFRIFSPLNQVLSLLVLILFWKSSSAIRLYLGLAFIFYVTADILTFAYFYPRNDILFKGAQLADVELLRTTSKQWVQMNWVRSSIVLIGVFFSFLALHKIYTRR